MIGHEVWGRGPGRVIALHGWFGDSGVYAPLLEGLDSETHSIALMDYRGYGRSRGLQGPYDFATIAEDALALADRLGWPTFSLIGHSMGGKAALKVAAVAPGRVERIVAITPVWAAPAPLDAETVASFRTAAGSSEVRAGILHNTTGGRYPMAWSRRLAAISELTSRTEAFAAYFEAWAFEDFAEQAQGLIPPTLIVVGAHDAGVPEALVRSTWLLQFPQARLEVLPESGHYPMFEQPPRLAALVAEHIAA